MPTQENRSLIDGLRCLQELVMSDAPVGSREMARRVGLEPTRANRLLRTLASQGLSEQGSDRKYRPGPGVHVLAAQSLQGSRLLTAALPDLEKLNRHELTTALGVLWRGHVCYLVHRRPGMRLDQAVGALPSGPLGRSSIGVLLHALHASHGDVDQVEDASEAQDDIVTADGVPLVEAAATARNEGHARLSFPTGEISIAVPVGVPVVAGLAMSGHITADRVPELLAELQEAAAHITRNLAR